MLPRPNHISQKLDRLIERLPKGTFLIVREIKGALTRRFFASPIGVYLDRKEHEYNLEQLTREWGSDGTRRRLRDN